MSGPAKYSPEWYERRNAGARERRAAERDALPRPGSAAFDALPSYAAKAEARGHYERAARDDWRALLAALRDLAVSLEYAASVLQAPERCAMREGLETARALLAKHEGADR